MTASSRRPRRLVAGVVSAVVVVAPLAVAGLVGSPNAVQDLLLSGGGAWLASPGRGYVTLVDGPSEQIAATVVAPSSGEFAVTQAGSSALVADGGAVSRVDGATFEVSQPVAFGQDGSDLSVLTGGDAVYVVDATQRLATVARADTLAVTRQLALSAEPGPGQTLVDADDRLWVVDATGGGLRWFDPDGTEGDVAADVGDRLVSVRGRAARIGLGESRATVSWLADDGSSDDWACRLDTRPGDDVQLVGSQDGDRVYAAVSQAGTLLVAGTDESDCGTVVPVSGPDADFGQLAQLDHFVFVPDRTTGTTTVVDTSTARVVAQIPLTDSGNDLQLLSHDGIVFYNDLDSDKAGVLRLGQDGLWEAGDALSKYDPGTGEATEVVTPDEVTATPDVAPPPDAAPADPAGPSPTATPPAARPNNPQPPTGGTTPPAGTPPAGVPPGGGAPDPEDPADPIPVVTGITSAAPVRAGESATFVATVSDPSGPWAWTVRDAGGAVLGTSADTDEFTLDVPASVPGGSALTVQLVVGTSTPATQTFSVAAAVVSTTTSLFLPTYAGNSFGGAFAGDVVDMSVSVASDSGGPAPSGEVTLVVDDPSRGRTTLGPVALADGTASFSDQAFPNPADVTLTATYAGTEDFLTSSASNLLVVEPPPVVALTGCRAGATPGSRIPYTEISPRTDGAAFDVYLDYAEADSFEIITTAQMSFVPGGTLADRYEVNEPDLGGRSAELNSLGAISRRTGAFKSFPLVQNFCFF